MLAATADPVRLAQVVANLLNNAAKYTAAGRPHRGCAAGAQASEAVDRVRDTGVGMPADLLARVFELFTQVDTRARPGRRAAWASA